ncbi:Gfo/Idh/MocA family oxidoreductase [Pectobacterium carotovorum subsp. carotovorum]|nr:Gfo/Idh/MocA family oxidoreductase [Pectobacterium carotovorum]MCL6339466.1 Gfo/Idh/MocA family oxidoreductase [Pectobacterium carotovorum subsp. carotovorum]MCL6343725.1 Gfo/Idh/MocA family oxidoreductase [Pectobacterium carotovorum subsp. carotovorum]
MKKKYAVVGTGGRAGLYLESIARDYQDQGQFVAFCDTNQTRMNYANQIVHKYGHDNVPTYRAEQFEQMIAETKPDVVIVTSLDRTHHHYIIRTMELGCDVISEKPMTIDEEKCQAIIDAINRTGRKLRVTFNYRYAPHHSKVRELIAAGVIGEVYSVHFEWLLNTEHGADYFRRWHRDKRNSGGLLVHKSTHHFDLVNFWLNSEPETVYAQGDLRFYGKANAEARGVTEFYSRSHNSAAAENDPFALHMNQSEQLTALYLDAEHEDGYYRDKSVFDDGINIEDVLGVMVRYKSKAIMTYSLNAYLPWEGLNVVFNGSKGRLEMKLVEKSYVNGGGQKEDEGALNECEIKIYPMFDDPYVVPVEFKAGGHGGGDQVMLNDLFGTPGPDPLHRAADYRDGAMSILTGIAANRSLRTELPVKISELAVNLKRGN